MNLPRKIFRPDSAVIVPALFLNKTEVLPYCDTLFSCVAKLDFSRGIMYRSESLFPKDIVELKECIKQGVCSLTKSKGITHVWVKGGES